MTQSLPAQLVLGIDVELIDTLLAEQPIPDIGQLKNANRIDNGPA
jgi:hypothetical protein